MAELNVSKLVTAHIDGDLDAMDYSGSVAEHGHNAARFTWGNCQEKAKESGLVTDENREELISHFMEYGAWERPEIEESLEAFVVQEIMAAIRELEHFLDLSDFTEDEWFEATKNQGGRLGKMEDGQWFMYFGI